MKSRIAQAAVLGVIGLFGTAANAVPNTETRVEEDRPEPTKTESDEPKPMSTHFYLNGGVGYGTVALNTFKAEENGERFTADLIPTRADGPSADLGIGFRLAVLTLGVRGSLIALNDDSARRTVGALHLWSIDGELGLRIPAGRIEPYLFAAGGYSKFGGLGDALSGVRRGMNIDGANARFGLGLDYFASQHVSIGARATAEILFLNRDSVPLRDLATMEQVGTINDVKARALESDGTTVGSAYALVVGPGLHF